MSRDPAAIGRYRVLKSLGAGAMGAVYLAEDPLLKRRVAVKIVQASGPAMDHARERFAREAEISARLNHPNVITVYDVGEDPQCGPFLAIEFVEGSSLAERITAGNLDDAGRLRILVLAMQGVEAAHAAGIVHRDIKPSNLMLGRDGRVKLMDFGIARGEDEGLTKTGAVVGTPAYISPEQLKGVPPSAATDRYAFAVMAFELFAGNRPFQADTASAMLFAIINDPPRVPDGFPPALAEVFSRALAKNPNERPPTLRVFLDELIAASKLDGKLRTRIQALLEAASPLPEAASANAAEATRLFDPTATRAPSATSSRTGTAAPPVPEPREAPALAEGIGAGTLLGVGGGVVAIAAVAVWFLVLRGGATAPESPTEIARAATALPAPTVMPTAQPQPTRAVPTAVPTAPPEPTIAPAAAATEAPRPQAEPTAPAVSVARTETNFATEPTSPLPSPRDLETLVRRELRRRDLTHVTVRVDDDHGVRLANLSDGGEERAARSAVAAADPELRVVAAEIRKPATPRQEIPKRASRRPPPEEPPPAAPAWGTIRSDGAERSD